MRTMTDREIAYCRRVDKNLEKKPLSREDKEAERRFDLEILNILGFQGKSQTPKRTRRIHTRREILRVRALHRLGYSHRQIEIMTGIPYQTVWRLCKEIKAKKREKP